MLAANVKSGFDQAWFETRLSFLFVVTYIPYISGAATNSRWCLAAIILPICLLFVKCNLKFNITYLFGLLFLIYAGLSIAWTYSDQAIYNYVHLIIIAEAFVLGFYLNTLKNVFEGLAVGIAVSSLLMLFGFQGGLFININTLAETSVIILIGLAVYGLWGHMIGVVPAIVWNGSRGAIMTVGLLFAIWIWKQSKLVTVLTILVMLIVVLSGYRSFTIYDRISIWKEIYEQPFTWLGNGFDSFSVLGLYNIYSRPMFAHNDLLQIYFELGVIGVVLAVAFFLSVMVVNKNEKWIVGAFIIISMFAFPLHLPVSSVIVLLTCGFIVNNRNRLFIPNNECRMALL